MLNHFAEMMGLDWPLTRPAVFVAAQHSKLISRKHAPLVPFDFVLALERTAADSGALPGVRLLRSLFFLMIGAPLRFCDTKDASHLFATDTAIGGVSINHKDGGGLDAVGNPSEGD